MAYYNFSRLLSCWSNNIEVKKEKSTIFSVDWIWICSYSGIAQGSHVEPLLRARSATTYRSAVVDMSWNTGEGAAVSTERRWHCSPCRRDTSGSRKPAWSSSCKGSSSTLSPGRSVHTWRKSKSPLCCKRPEQKSRIEMDKWKWHFPSSQKTHSLHNTTQNTQTLFTITVTYQETDTFTFLTKVWWQDGYHSVWTVNRSQ